MRKVLIALSSVILALFFILAASTQINAQEGKKAATEVSKNCGKCPEAAKCDKTGQSKECAHAKKEACCKAECGKECKHEASAAKSQCCETKAETKSGCQKTKCPMASK